MELPYPPRLGSKARRLVSSLERVKQRSSPCNEKIRVLQLVAGFGRGNEHGVEFLILRHTRFDSTCTQKLAAGRASDRLWLSHAKV